MFLIALTGGIASGKSVVAKRLAELGGVLIDADALARDVVEPGTPGLEQIVEAFGAGVLTSDGSLNRPVLASIVFSDPTQRAKLNAITHPLIAAKSSAIISAAPADAVVVRDIPLFVETKANPADYDLVVVVRADTETRVERMIEHRGMTREQAQQRLDAQASEAERLAVADVVINNDGDLDDTIRQVDALWASLPSRSHRIPG